MLRYTYSPLENTINDQERERRHPYQASVLVILSRRSVLTFSLNFIIFYAISAPIWGSIPPDGTWD